MKPRGNFEGIPIFSETCYPVTTVPKKLITCTRVIFMRISAYGFESLDRGGSLTIADLSGKDKDD